MQIEYFLFQFQEVKIGNVKNHCNAWSNVRGWDTILREKNKFWVAILY